MENKTKELRTAIDALFKAIEPNSTTDDLAGYIDEIIGEIDDEICDKKQKISDLWMEIDELKPVDLFNREKEPFTHKEDVYSYLYQNFEYMTMKDRQRFILVLLTGRSDDFSSQYTSNSERDRVWELIREWDGLK